MKKREGLKERWFSVGSRMSERELRERVLRFIREGCGFKRRKRWDPFVPRTRRF